MGQVVLFLTSVVTHAAALEITANQDVGVRELDLTTARLIFGMRLLKWPDGTPVRVFVLEGDSDIHQRFAKEKLQVFAYQLQQAWDRLVFSGTGQAPNQVATVEEMRKRVTMTPGAIGYLPDDYLRDDVSIIEIKAQ
ncbi:hypothetical protein CCR96_18145 [Halochromatium roseum]|nr:hypothetical protein [Halochromatium roseum]